MKSITTIIIILFMFGMSAAKANDLEFISAVNNFTGKNNNLGNILKLYNSRLDSKLLETSNHLLLQSLSKQNKSEIQSAIATIIGGINSENNSRDGMEALMIELIFSLERVLFFSPEKTGEFPRHSYIGSRRFISFIINKYHELLKKNYFYSSDCFSEVVSHGNSDKGSRVGLKRIYIGLDSGIGNLLSKFGIGSGKEDVLSKSGRASVEKFGHAIGKYRNPARKLDVNSIVELDKLQNVYYCYGRNILRNNIPSDEVIDWYISRYSKEKPIRWQRTSDADLLFYYVMVYSDRIKQEQINKVLNALEAGGDYLLVTYIYQSLSPDKVFNYLLAKYNEGKFSKDAIKLLSMNKKVSEEEFNQLVELWARDTTVGKEGLLGVIANNKQYFSKKSLDIVYKQHLELSRGNLSLILPLYISDAQRHENLNSLILSNYDENLKKIFGSGDSFIFSMLSYHKSHYSMSNNLSSNYYLMSMFTDKELMDPVPGTIDSKVVKLKQYIINGLTGFLKKNQAYQYEKHLLHWYLGEMKKFEASIREDKELFKIVKVHYNGWLRNQVRRAVDDACSYRMHAPDRVVKYRIKRYPDYYLRYDNNRRILNKFIETGLLTSFLERTKSILELLDHSYVDNKFTRCIGVDPTLPPKDFFVFVSGIKKNIKNNELKPILGRVSKKFTVSRDFGGGTTGKAVKDFKYSVLRNKNKFSYLSDLLQRPFVSLNGKSACSVVSYTGQEGFPDGSLCFSKEQGAWKFSSYTNGGD